jgi:hypothetical protein
MTETDLELLRAEVSKVTTEEAVQETPAACRVEVRRCE